MLFSNKHQHIWSLQPVLHSRRKWVHITSCHWEFELWSPHTHKLLVNEHEIMMFSLFLKPLCWEYSYPCVIWQPHWEKFPHFCWTSMVNLVYLMLTGREKLCHARKASVCSSSWTPETKSRTPHHHFCIYICSLFCFFSCCWAQLSNLFSFHSPSSYVIASSKMASMLRDKN